MSSDLTMQRARLADKKRTLAEMNLRAEAHVIELRNILDPTLEDYTALRMNLFRAEARQLEKLHDEMTELTRQIEKAEAYLG